MTAVNSIVQSIHKIRIQVLSKDHRCLLFELSVRTSIYEPYDGYSGPLSDIICLFDDTQSLPKTLQSGIITSLNLQMRKMSQGDVNYYVEGQGTRMWLILL